MKITFYGAAQTVTGSQHLVEIAGKRVLLDCGLYQGRRAEAYERNSHLPFDPTSIDCAILSHAHIDHSGNLPTLVKRGFRGPIHCTRATADLAAIMLQDTAHIQVEDAEFLARHSEDGNRPPNEPLYTPDDATRAVKHFQGHDYHQTFEPLPGLRVQFFDAGHILGSAVTRIEFAEDGQARSLVFTGDLGHRGTPIIRDPETISGADVVISESTYGGQVHEDLQDTEGALRDLISRITQRRGKVIIPAFSLGRTQTIIYYLNKLSNSKDLPRVPIYVDSPLASQVTDVYRRHPECFDEDTRTILETDPDLFGFRSFHTIRSIEESKSLNRQDGPLVIIASSGMCEGGRVRHHLAHAVSDPANAVLIVGYQAEHTLGRRLVEHQPRVKILDRWYDLRAEVVVLNGFSSHADRADMAWWFGALTPKPRRVFLVHGEGENQPALAEVIRPLVDGPVEIPARGQTFDV